MRRPRPIDRVLYAVALDGQTVTFECKDGGHRTKATYPEKGPRAVTGWWLQRMAGPNGYWRKDRTDGRRGHLYGPCRTCDKEAS